MLQEKLSSDQVVTTGLETKLFAGSLVSSIQMNCFLKCAPDSLQQCKAPSNLPEHVTDWNDDFRKKKLTLAM